MGVIRRIDVDSNSDVSAIWRYTAENYTDLITVVAPVANEGELAFVYESQGIWLINRKLKGIYIFQLGIWIYGNQELQDKIQADELLISTITRPMAISVTAFSKDFILMTTGLTDKIVTFPISPIKDNIIEVSKRDNGIGNCIVNGNGKTINGQLTDIIQFQNTTNTYHYDGVSDWIKK